MKRGSLEARVSRLEGTEAGVCHVCEGRSGPVGVYIEGEDGIGRDADGGPMPASVPAWTCAGCGRSYACTPIVILVEGRSKSLRGAAQQPAPHYARGSCASMPQEGR